MNVDNSVGFLNSTRLMYGPWQAFERDVARLLVACGFDDVRIVGGTGDKGGDILGVSDGDTWVFQCKHTTSSPPPVSAINEVVAAGQYYRAKHLVVATSRPPTDAMYVERQRFMQNGLKVELADPAMLLNLMSRAPEFPKARRKLREYQEDVARRFRDALIDTGRSLVILATGLGKTVVMADVVADLMRDGLILENRVLVLAHTRAIVDQLQHNFWFQLPKWVPTHRLADGEFPSYWDGVTFATMQSALSHIDTLPQFGLALVDEAHHGGAETYKRVIDRLRPEMLGGVTATPWRGDGYDIEEIFGPPQARIGISEGLQKGFLAEVEYKLLADNIDWSFVQESSKHKYSLSQLNTRLILPTRDEQAARIIREVFSREKRKAAIVFTRSIEHAVSFSGMLTFYGLRAQPLSSETLPRDQDVVMSRFKEGQLDVICTVDLFNEGVDVPDVDLIVFMRVTHSRRIFVQQLGRGLRPTPDKDRVIVLDFVTDLRRVAEIVELDRASRAGDVERLGLHGSLVQFSDQSAGSFLKEWMLDQASLILREGDSRLELPEFEFPAPHPPGGVQ